MGCSPWGIKGSDTTERLTLSLLSSITTFLPAVKSHGRRERSRDREGSGERGVGGKKERKVPK